MLEKFFKLNEKGTTVKTEILAGVTTFLAMAYILAVNPAMLGETGMSVQGVFPCNCYFFCSGNNYYGISGKLSSCFICRYGS